MEAPSPADLAVFVVAPEFSRDATNAAFDADPGGVSRWYEAVMKDRVK